MVYVILIQKEILCIEACYIRETLKLNMLTKSKSTVISKA